MIPPPPTAFPALHRVGLRPATLLHRIHRSGFAGNAFNPCLGRPSRFAPLRRPDGRCIPTLYAATTFECAVHETLFHEIQHDAKHKSIRFDEIENLDYAVLRPPRELALAGPFQADPSQVRTTRLPLT